MRLLPITLVVSALLLVAMPARAEASRYVLFGVQDDAWLVSGPGTMDERLAELDRLGVEAYRFTLRWDEIASRRPSGPSSHVDPAYDWTLPDAVLKGLRERGIAPIVTIWGTPRWANGGRAPNWAPKSAASLAAFAGAAATRYRRDVRHWTIWNEPNKPRFLRPVSARLYTTLLNASYAAIKRAAPGAKVAGGVTAPRGGIGGISPVRFIRAMGAYGARLDAYAHNPYPLSRQQTPWAGGCGHCETITMASLERLLREVRAAFGRRRIWLTEYGYQTNPPERLLGVTYSQQVAYASAAARRVYLAPDVDFLIHFMVQDDGDPGGWQSGFRATSGQAKPAYHTWSLPLAQTSRRAFRTTVWGQVRTRAGRETYRLQQWRHGRWHWVGPLRTTDRRGYFTRVLRAAPGSRVRIFSFSERTYSGIVRVS